MTHSNIVIIGSGFSGLGLAIKLKLAGHEDFVILERATEVGGTWRDNTYPGCACDVQSHLYSFSFAPNPNWSRSYSPQPEILNYLKDCVRKFKLESHLRFSEDVRSATWSSDEKLWKIETSQGFRTSRFLAAAPGPLSEPSVPNLPALKDFKGEVFHSSRWNHDFDFENKRVGVIGTGASAIQFVPILQKKVRELTVFQRSAAWVVPRPNRVLSVLEHRIFTKFPFVQKTVRGAINTMRELFVIGFKRPKILRLLEFFIKWNLAQAVPNRDLRKKLTPNYRLGCKRVSLSDDFWPAMAKKNVRLETGPLEGQTFENLDAVILATGFHVTDSSFNKRIKNEKGRSLEDVWAGSPKAYLGTLTSSFPNLFFILGPNTGLGHNSVVAMAEIQVEYIVQLIGYMKQRDLRVIETKPETQARYVKELDQESLHTVWSTGGCKSWYLDRTGRNSTLWPASTSAFATRLKSFDPIDFDLSL